MSTAKDVSVAGLFDLRGKTVIVTGGTGGIGLVLTVALAEAGADIVSIQIPNDPGASHLRDTVEHLGRNFRYFDSNLKDYASLAQTFEGIWRSGCTPDILLNCAGITRHSKVEDTPIAYLDDVCRIPSSNLLLLSSSLWLTDGGDGYQFQSRLRRIPRIWQTIAQARPPRKDDPYRLDGSTTRADQYFRLRTEQSRGESPYESAKQ